jgi:porin
MILAGLPALAQTPSATEVNISPIQQVGKTLADHGIYLNASYFGEFAGNPTGGAAQGSDYADQVAAGADIDLQKLAGWQGGAMHIEFTNRDGHNQGADVINNSVATQQIYGGGQTYYLTT